MIGLVSLLLFRMSRQKLERLWLASDVLKFLEEKWVKAIGSGSFVWMYLEKSLFYIGYHEFGQKEGILGPRHSRRDMAENGVHIKTRRVSRLNKSLK